MWNYRFLSMRLIILTLVLIPTKISATSTKVRVNEINRRTPSSRRVMKKCKGSKGGKGKKGDTAPASDPSSRRRINAHDYFDIYNKITVDSAKPAAKIEHSSAQKKTKSPSAQKKTKSPDDECSDPPSLAPSVSLAPSTMPSELPSLNPSLLPSSHPSFSPSISQSFPFYVWL